MFIYDAITEFVVFKNFIYTWIYCINEDKMITRKVGAIGSGHHIFVPKAVMEDRGIEAGDYVMIDIVKVIKHNAITPTS